MGHEITNSLVLTLASLQICPLFSFFMIYPVSFSSSNDSWIGINTNKLLAFAIKAVMTWHHSFSSFCFSRVNACGNTTMAYLSPERMSPVVCEALNKSQGIMRVATFHACRRSETTHRHANLVQIRTPPATSEEVEP